MLRTQTQWGRQIELFHFKCFVMSHWEKSCQRGWGDDGTGSNTQTKPNHNEDTIWPPLITPSLKHNVETTFFYFPGGPGYKGVSQGQRAGFVGLGSWGKMWREVKLSWWEKRETSNLDASNHKGRSDYVRLQDHPCQMIPRLPTNVQG